MSKVATKIEEEESISKQVAVMGDTVVEGVQDGIASVEKEETQMNEEFIVPRKGIVENCLALNVRQTATPNGIVDNVIVAGTEITINNDSTKDFYSITTAEGNSGFCRKQFITIY